MKIVVVVDVQNDFVTGSLGSDMAKEVAPRIVEFLNEIKSNPDYKIFATRDTHGENYLSTYEGKNLPVPHCIKGTWGWQLIDGVKEIVDEYNIIDKATFMAEGLPSYISNGCWQEEGVNGSSVDEVILVGFCTSICVVSNALYLRGIWPNVKISVIDNLCGDINEESHRAALAVLGNCQIFTPADKNSL